MNKPIKPKYTPGPWRAYPYNGAYCICMVPTPGTPKRIAEGTSKEDARLIAAAPELLEALEHLKQYVLYSDRMDMDEALNKATRALNKATGGAE